jgi:hypothetical protein
MVFLTHFDSLMGHINTFENPLLVESVYIYIYIGKKIQFRPQTITFSPDSPKLPWLVRWPPNYQNL